jgi:hypothetical protein
MRNQVLAKVGTRIVPTIASLAALAMLADPLAVRADEGDTGVGQGGDIEKALQQGGQRFAFEVAENGARFVFDEAPVDADGFPLYGNPFITQGFIYPAGTLDPDDPARDGVILIVDDQGNLIDVQPEFPELLLGIWICEGKVFAQEGFSIETGPTVFTTQLYDFKEVGGAFGAISLTSSGLELIDLGVPIERAVIGGTGPFRRARGEIAQTFLGVNETEGFILRFEAKLQ